MQAPTVDVLFGNDERHLVRGSDKVSIDEGIVKFRISVPKRTQIFLDDEELDVMWAADGRTAYAQIDLTNQVGFHRVSFRLGTEFFFYDFQTNTTKAAWEEVLEMASHLSRHVYTYRRQFRYTLPDGTKRTVPLPEIEFGWLRDRVFEICKLVDDISRRSGKQSYQSIVTSFQGRRVAVSQTLAHLRENHHLLEEGNGGPIVVENVEYWPSAVRVRESHHEPARFEHEQISYFLRMLAMSCERIRKTVPKEVEPHINEWAVRIARARNLPLMKRYDTPKLRYPWSPVPTMLQRTDSRYRRLRLFQSEYLMNIAPQDCGDDAARVNLKNISEIYQAFAGHIIGKAFGLEYVSRQFDLRERDSKNRSMFGGSVSMYYDVRPPGEFLPSWRDKTERPNLDRPDIVLVDHGSGSVVLLDVKFRVDAEGLRVLGADLQEMQGYMQSFGMSVGGILFPGKGEVRKISSMGNTLVEFPFRPQKNDHQALLQKVRETIASMWTQPSF